MIVPDEDVDIFYVWGIPVILFKPWEVAGIPFTLMEHFDFDFWSNYVIYYFEQIKPVFDLVASDLFWLLEKLLLYPDMVDMDGFWLL